MLFSLPIYIKIYSNRMIIKSFGKDNRELTGTPEKPFTTQRLLIGHFKEAEKTLSQGIKQLRGSGLFKRTPIAVIHPFEKIDGGLSEVEISILRELALSAGAAKVVVYEGPVLTETGVLELLK